MTQFSKGPWASNVPPSSSGFGRAIVAVRDDGPDVFVAYVGNWKQDPAVEDADAKLIAAAPEMLRVLQSFRDEFGDIIDGDEELPGADAVDALCRVWPLVKDAIAMATGASADTAPTGVIESAPSWYLVTGRVHGDDEDSADVFYASGRERACEMFKQWLLDNMADSSDAPEIYINTVANCGQTKPILE